MNRKLLIAGLALLPITAQADFSYNHLELGYIDTELDTSGFDVDGDGYGVNVSMALNDQIHLVAGYASQDFDFGVDVDQWQAGAGYHYSFNPNVDFVATVTYLDVTIDTPFRDVDDDGFGLGAGVRGRLGEQFEVEAGLDYVDLGDSDTAVRVGGRYYFNEQFAVGAGVSHSDDATTWRVGVRIQFGQ